MFSRLGVILLADAIDQAQALDEAGREASLDAFRQRQSRSLKPWNLSTHCEDCGVLISEQRRKVLPGVVTCVSCQAEREKR